jgi:general stress protein YciG
MGRLFTLYINIRCPAAGKSYAKNSDGFKALIVRVISHQIRLVLKRQLYGGVIMALRRGFACMSPEKQKEIASKGGRAAHNKGTAHEWTSEEAREAGRKGGQVSHGGGRQRTR